MVEVENLVIIKGFLFYFIFMSLVFLEDLVGICFKGVEELGCWEVIVVV